MAVDLRESWHIAVGGCCDRLTPKCLGFLQVQVYLGQLAAKKRKDEKNAWKTTHSSRGSAQHGENEIQRRNLRYEQRQISRSPPSLPYVLQYHRRENIPFLRELLGAGKPALFSHAHIFQRYAIFSCKDYQRICRSVQPCTNHMLGTSTTNHIMFLR